MRHAVAQCAPAKHAQCVICKKMDAILEDHMAVERQVGGENPLQRVRDGHLDFVGCEGGV